MRTHIFLDASAASSMKHIVRKQQIKENIISFTDDLMVGPLGNISLIDTQEERFQWWEQVLNEEDKHINMEYLLESYKHFNSWIHSLSDKERLLFWVGDSASEHTGFMYLLTIIPESVPVSVVMASQAYSKKYGKFRPFTAGEIKPEQLISLLDDSKPLSSHMKKKYINNWIQLLNDNGNLRIRRNRQIETVPEEFFDETIISFAVKISKLKEYEKHNGFFPAMRLVGEIVGRQKQKVSDVFIEWRIQKLIHSNFLAFEGSLTAPRLYKIKPNIT